MYDIWSKFVRACWLISKPIVTQQEINQADMLFQAYVKSLQNKFGTEAIKPNHHMTCHLRECVEDFGPVHSYWLFAFERINGYLGDYQTNFKGIEVTLMRKFLADRELATKAMGLPESFYESCSIPVAKMCSTKPNEIMRVSVHTQSIPEKPKFQCAKLWTDICHVSVPNKVSDPSMKGKQLHRFDADDIDLLVSMYSSMYPYLEGLSVSNIPSLVIKFDVLSIGSERFTCANNAQCFILANWSDENGCIDKNDTQKRLGRIKYFFKHGIRLGTDQSATHILCAVQWYTEFKDTLPVGYAEPVQVFRKKCLSPGPASFMPVQRISSKCAYGFGKVNGYKDCIIVSPVRFDAFITNCQ